MNKEWITTAELIAYLKAHPDDEKECRLYLGAVWAAPYAIA